MRIGELARAAGVGVETVRFYERRGLLPATARTAAGYRSYAADDLARLRFVRRAKALGFSLREIADLLALRGDESTSCGEVARRAQVKVEDVERRMRELEAIRLALTRLAAECRGGRVAPGACALLAYLGEEPAATG